MITLYFFSRKNLLPAPIGTVTELFTTFGTVDQFAVVKLSVLSRLNPDPATATFQERVNVVPVRLIANVGLPVAGPRSSTSSLMILVLCSLPARL